MYGSPWVPTFNDWAFMRDDAELAGVWARIPDDVDVLMTHGPPLGMGDLVVDGRRAGSETLARRIAGLKHLRLHLFGHIHESHGSRDRIGHAVVANVSYVDFHYRPVQPPVLFEL